MALGWSAPSLAGGPIPGRIVLAALQSRHRFGVPRGLIGLKVRGNRTGHWHTFPVMAAPSAGGLIVLPGRADEKRWWRNLCRPSAVEICRSGVWEPADAWVVSVYDCSYPASRAAYRRRYPRATVPSQTPLVRIVPRLGTVGRGTPAPVEPVVGDR